MNRRTFLSRIGITAAPLAGAAVGYETAAGSTVRAVATGNRNIPNVKVTSQENKTYQFYDDLVKQKIVLVNFFYANCSGICPRLTSALVKVQKALGERVGRDVFIYSISLKPEEDTPKHLAHYAGMHGIKPGSGWLFLRAARSDMELLRERLGFKDSDPVLDADINQHTGLLRFGNDKYDRWSAYPLMGNVQTIAQLVREMDPSTPKGSIY